MRRKRGRTAPEARAKADVGLHAGPTVPYDPIPETDARRLVDTAIEVLRDVGVGFELDARAAKLFTEAGCDIAPDGVTRFDPDLVEETIRSVAKSVKLWNRAGEEFIQIDNRHTWFIPGMTAIQVVGLEPGEARTSTRDDLAAITRVADALPNIDAVCIACKNVGRSDIFGEIDEFAVLAENTGKPLEYLCENSDSLNVVIDMAAAIRGGRSALAEKPYFLQIVTPLPLYYAQAHIEQIITAVEAGVPVAMGTVTIGGASAPITMAGCLVHCLATDLAGMVLAQLVRKGSFCIGGSDACYMEPATGGRGGFPQLLLSDMVHCQISRMLGIPSMTGVGGRARAARFDQDAACEIAANMMQTFHSRPATCDYMGLMDEGMTYSPHALLYGNELAGLLRNMWRGVRIDDEMLAMDLTRREGPRGNYLAQPHTAEHCRSELWQARYLGANQPLSLNNLPEVDLFGRIDADLREITASHRPEALPGSIVSEIRSIQRAFEDARGGRARASGPTAE